VNTNKKRIHQDSYERGCGQLGDPYWVAHILEVCECISRHLPMHNKPLVKTKEAQYPVLTVRWISEKPALSEVGTHSRDQAEEEER